VLSLNLQEGRLEFSFPKGLAIGALSDDDVSAMEVGSGMIEIVEGFIYLDSNLSVDCETTCELSFWLPGYNIF